MDIVIISRRAKRKLPYQFYVGRPTPLGNPYSHLDDVPNTTKVDTVDEAVRLYALWLDAKLVEGDVGVRNKLNLLYSIAKRNTIYLECWCMDEIKPSKRDHACHTTVIRDKLLSVKKNIHTS